MELLYRFSIDPPSILRLINWLPPKVAALENLSDITPLGSRRTMAFPLFPDLPLRFPWIADPDLYYLAPSSFLS
jgi:hypothetical protein